MGTLTFMLHRARNGISAVDSHCSMARWPVNALWYTQTQWPFSQLLQGTNAHTLVTAVILRSVDRAA